MPNIVTDDGEIKAEPKRTGYCQACDADLYGDNPLKLCFVCADRFARAWARVFGKEARS